MMCCDDVQLVRAKGSAIFLYVSFCWIGRRRRRKRLVDVRSKEMGDYKGSVGMCSR